MLIEKQWTGKENKQVLRRTKYQDQIASEEVACDANGKRQVPSKSSLQPLAGHRLHLYGLQGRLVAVVSGGGDGGGKPRSG